MLCRVSEALRQEAWLTSESFVENTGKTQTAQFILWTDKTGGLIKEAIYIQLDRPSLLSDTVPVLSSLLVQFVWKGCHEKASSV